MEPLRNLITTFLVLTYATLNCQIVTVNDSLEIEFKKTKTYSNPKIHSKDKHKDKDLERILVRLDVAALYDQPVDINAFSLLDEANKFRYRIALYSGYYKGISYKFHEDGTPYLKEEVLNRRGKQFKFLPKYDPTVFDSFGTFDFPGYTVVEIPRRYYNAASGEVISVVYYSPAQRPKFGVDLEFAIFINYDDPKLKLYYGNEFICDVEFEK
jgi:hypothetical protein